MKIDLLRLLNDIDKCIKVDFIYSFDKEYLKGTDLISLDDIHVQGEITNNNLDGININLIVSGKMVLPCAITLKPVDYPFEINIVGDIDELTQDLDKNEINLENSIDILPIIWENILLEIPTRIISKNVDNVKLSGEGWKLITDEEQPKSTPFSGLKELLDDSEVR